jgi:hypothetical protein
MKKQKESEKSRTMSEVNMEQRERERLERVKSLPICANCLHLNGDEAKLVVKAEFTSTMYPCRRFPAEVMKECEDTCGEFKEKNYGL